MGKNTEVMDITVERKSQFGICYKNQWFNMSQYADVKLTDFTVGQSYKVAVDVSKTGKTYISGLVSSGGTKPDPEKAASVKQETRAVTDPVPATQLVGTQRDLLIVSQASLKSVLESPTIASLAAVMPEDKVPDLIRRYTNLGVEIVLEIVGKHANADK